jgi:hypothetical protein
MCDLSWPGGIGEERHSKCLRRLLKDSCLWVVSRQIFPSQNHRNEGLKKGSVLERMMEQRKRREVADMQDTTGFNGPEPSV